MNEKEAIKHLQEKGYKVTSPVRTGGIYLIKFINNKMNEKYSVRRRFNSTHQGSFPADSKIAWVDFSKLDWDDLPAFAIEASGTHHSNKRKETS
jgi:hypothetical protein